MNKQNLDNALDGSGTALKEVAGKTGEDKPPVDHTPSPVDPKNMPKNCNLEAKSY